MTEEGEAVRDPDTGLCVRCKVDKYHLNCKFNCNHWFHFKVGEPGEFVGIIQQHHPIREFTGYSDRSVRTNKCFAFDM